MNAKQLAVISVGANVLLLGVVIALLRQPAAPRARLVETNTPPQFIERRAEVAVAEPFDWRKVESSDYRQYVANLRAIGCPEQTVRDIIIADVAALFDARRQALLLPEEDFKFWRADDSIFAAQPADRLRRKFEQLRALSEQKRDVLRELLGIEVPDRTEAVFAPLNPREQMLGFLPAAKRAQVEEIERRFSAQLMRRWPDGSGAEQLSDYKKLKTDKRAELEKLLTPEELEDYDVRFSATAVNLRARLGSLNASEQEFRAMVKLKKQFDDEFGDFLSFDPNDAAARERKARAALELDEQMRAVLGDKRHEQFQREQDWAYRSAATATVEAGLPPRAAASVFEMKKIALAEVEVIQADHLLTAEQRQSMLDEVRLAVEEAVISVLGKEGYEAYQKQPGASWLGELNRVSRQAPVEPRDKARPQFSEARFLEPPPPEQPNAEPPAPEQ